MGRAQTYIDPDAHVRPFTADGTISRYRIVVLSTLGKVKAPTGADILGEIILGVALEDATDGQQVSVAMAGAIVPIDMVGTIAIGDKIVVSGTVGKGVAANVFTTHPGTQVVGMALEVGASGQRSAVLVWPDIMRNGTMQTMTAQGGITATNIVIVGSSNNTAAQAGADPTSKVIGVAIDTALDTAPVRVVTNGPALITAASSGSVDRGDPLTSAASGLAKASAPATGVNSMVVGTAAASVADGATGICLVSPYTWQGA